MPHRFRNIVLLLLLALNCGSRFAMAGATVSATATLTVTGAEQPNGVWDSGSMAVSFNGFSETVNYSQFSSSASLASALAAMFTRDFNRYGLWAKAGANANSDPTVITFQLTNGQAFGSISYSVSTASFALVPSGFASPGPVVADSGTVTLQVNGATVASAHYADGSTPTSIAQSLADAASSVLVSVQADGNLLYLASKQTGSAVNYPYSVTVTSASNTFTSPSFTISPMADTMSGGANASSSTGPVYSYSITNSSGGSGYDAAGNILNLTDSVMGTWSYGYDNLNRLVSGQATAGAYAAQSPYLCWSYDSFGNRTHQSLSNQPFVNAKGSACQAAGGASLADTSTVPAANNQIASSLVPGAPAAITPTYDAAGNLTFDGVNTYVYDAEERVCAVHGVFGMTGYQYDAGGNRVGKGSITSMSCDITANGYQPTNDYVLDQSGGQMTELAAEENGTVAWQHTNVMADGRLIATYDLTGLHFYLNDALGTRRAQTDSAGVLEQNCLSLPFGDQLNCTISISGPTEHHFTGKERDAETGLDYFGARYYASNLGRFISPDWSAKEEPVPYAKLDNPQSLNLYGYMLNSPLGGVDADGHQQAGVSAPTVPNTIGPSTPGYTLYLSEMAETALVDGITLTRIGAGALLVPFTLVQKMGDGTLHQHRQPGVCYLDGDEPPEPEPEPLPAAAGGARMGGGRRSIIFGAADLMQNLQPGQVNTVTITYTGKRGTDYAAANQAAGLGTSQRPPKGYSWHHVADYNPVTNTGTMQLVKTEAHRAKGHEGGVKQYEQAKGRKYDEK